MKLPPLMAPKFTPKTLLLQTFSTEYPSTNNNACEVDLRSRTIKCIQGFLKREGSVKIGDESFNKKPLPVKRKSIDMIIKGLNVPLLDGYAQFCLDSARNMGAKCRGVTALPTRIERWSVLSSPHVHKTTWTQLERRTHGRILCLYGLHSELVPKYIWYVQQHTPPDVKFESFIHKYHDMESLLLSFTNNKK